MAVEGRKRCEDEPKFVKAEAIKVNISSDFEDNVMAKLDELKKGVWNNRDNMMVTNLEKLENVAESLGEQYMNIEAKLDDLNGKVVMNSGKQEHMAESLGKQCRNIEAKFEELNGIVNKFSGELMGKINDVEKSLEAEKKCCADLQNNFDEQFETIGEKSMAGDVLDSRCQTAALGGIASKDASKYWRNRCRELVGNNRQKLGKITDNMLAMDKDHYDEQLFIWAQGAYGHE
eukprot:TRINITY_DN35615_c0_g1_i4.p1 TRINITY_DN35615_c0_g1~~TRINITY_DN35615_c0_g1_i4.p1  ORF type:complete len:242 (+),score=82.68 TRINITY_DN35615_c0_g1_i4:31-726(+)